VKLEFRARKGGGAEAPAPGEVHLAAADAEDAGRRDLANLVLEKGLAGLLRGDGEPETLVLPRVPTLDDMLAALFVTREVNGEPLPDGAKAFARYAALVREGLQPGDVPLDRSLEGVYQAILNLAGGDLTDPATAGRFRREWQKLSDVVCHGCEASTDPFRTPLCDRPEFARERAFLARDREVYQQDVLRGERWAVQIPGGPEAASALVLEQPKSLLFKQWARRDEEAPHGSAYLLLGVKWKSGAWVFSTDPVQRLPIKALAEELQNAERAKSPETCDEDPWFDGAPFGHTLVAAPRAGTSLEDAEVLKVARAWAHAKPVKSGPGTVSGRRASQVAALAAAALLGVGIALMGTWGGGPTSPGEEVDFTARGAIIEDPDDVVRNLQQGTGLALIVAVGEVPGNDYGLQPLRAAVPDASRVYTMLRDRFGFAEDNLWLLADEPDRALDADGTPLPNRDVPTRENVSRALEEIAKVTKQAKQEGKRTQFVLYYAGHGQTEARAEDIGYLVLSGYLEGEADGVPADIRGYDMGHLSRDVARMVGSSHQLLLVDCCFSGFAATARGNPLENPSSLYELWGRRAHVIITAGTAEQRAWEKKKHGVDSSMFARVLLDGLGANEGEPMLADANRDGLVTDAELGAWLSQQVPKEFSRYAQETQTPVYVRGLPGDDVGQFLFVPSAADVP
jgi:hypothetical protein